MSSSPPPDAPRDPRKPPRDPRKRLAGYAIHGVTASGIVLALLAMLEVARESPDPRWVFLWLGLAILLDAADGPLARAVDIKRNAPALDGRKIDDIVDYLTFTFIPLVLVVRMGWAGGPRWLVISAVGLAMIASLLGFAHRDAKDERAGFFRGFPSYWNLLAYYFGLAVAFYGAAGGIAVTVSLFVFAVLTVLPLRFLYLNLAPPPWRAPLMLGACAWGLLLLLVLPWYPHPADPSGSIREAIFWISLLYPAVYVGASVYLDLPHHRNGQDPVQQR